MKTTQSIKQMDIKQAHAFALQLAASPAIGLHLEDADRRSAVKPAPPTRDDNEQCYPSSNNARAASKMKAKPAPLPPGAAAPRRDVPRLDIPHFQPFPTASGLLTPGGGLRLPPTVISRHMPLPIKNLPTLPPITPRAGPSTPTRRRRPSLHSVPSLPHIGHDDERDDETDMDLNMDEIDEEDEDAEDDMMTPPRDADTHDHSTATHSPMTSDSEEGDGSSMLTHTTVTRGDRDEHYSTDHIPHIEHTGHLPNMDISFAENGNSEDTPTPQPKFHLSTSANEGYFAIQSTSSSQGPVLPSIITTAASPDGASPVVALQSAKDDSRQGSQHNKIIEIDSASNEASIPLKPTLHHQQPSTSQSPASPPPNYPTPRPSFYRQTSRSMANLISSMAAEATMPAPKLAEKDLKHPAPLKRRTSLPDLNPPMYPAGSRLLSRDSFAQSTFANGLQPSPRDEEGAEDLPAYALTVPLLAALMPRKVEFDQPGVQSEDRSWRRVWCVLHGTSFKVYEGEKGLEKVQGWLGRAVMPNGKHLNEKDRIKIQSFSRHPEGETAQKYEASPSARSDSLYGDPSESPSGSSRQSQYPSSSNTSVASSRRSSMSSTFLPTPSPVQHPIQHRRTVPGATHAPSSYPQGRRSASESIGNTSPSHSRFRSSTSTSSRTRGSSTSSRSPRADEDFEFYQTAYDIPDISSITSRPLIRHYTMQKAESGVAIDYGKRPNVIRVRLEGEQFLLQAKDVKEVVEWIEGFQAAADIALDLDERTMPRGPMFPRRRRRRRTTRVLVPTP